MRKTWFFPIILDICRGYSLVFIFWPNNLKKNQKEVEEQQDFPRFLGMKQSNVDTRGSNLLPLANTIHTVASLAANFWFTNADFYIHPIATDVHFSRLSTIEFHLYTNHIAIRWVVKSAQHLSPWVIYTSTFWENGGERNESFLFSLLFDFQTLFISCNHIF